jgi:hypothetical protein
VRLAIALAVAASPALALDPSACVRVVQDPAPGERPGPPDASGIAPYFRSEQKLPVDLGGGWVAEPYEVASEVGTQIGTRVIDCASGTNLTVVEQARSPENRVIFDARIRAIPAMREAIAAPEAITVRALVARLEAGGANVGRDQNRKDVEACGCAAFYPSLRGGKTTWSAR